ncbi:hypothetical protein V8C26DRAFT_408062 [Trichoderma gracile]
MVVEFRAGIETETGALGAQHLFSIFCLIFAYLCFFGIQVSSIQSSGFRLLFFSFFFFVSASSAFLL